MDMAPQPFVVTQQATVLDAKHAYFEGDFERCLAICLDIRVSTLAMASEVALMRARAYLRTARPREAEHAILDARETHATLDATLTAQMLLASALIDQGDADAGIALLEKAARHSDRAHFGIRSEIALCTALGYWARGEIDAALANLNAVDPRSDIIHARALQLRAWCYSGLRDYRRAAEFLRLTLLRLDACQASDHAITAAAIASLAILAAELFDKDIARFVEVRARRVDWPARMSQQRYETLEHQALFHEFTGDTVRAYQFATRAREAASTLAAELFGWVLSSAIARNAGEGYSAIVSAQRARALFALLDADEFVGQARSSVLGFAENCAYFDPAQAAELMASYRAVEPRAATLASPQDARLIAHEAYVGGVVALAHGDRERARACYREAFDAFRDLGYVRRAAISAHALLKLGLEDEDNAELVRYLSTRLAGTDNYITKSLTTPADKRRGSIERRPVIAELPRAQRELVSLICLGKTNKEIAQLRNLSEQTIKNVLTKHVFPAFGVSSRAALVSACLSDRFKRMGN